MNSYLSVIGVAAILGLVILRLAIKAAVLNARLEGFREAQRQQMPIGNYGYGIGYRLLRFLATIGFLTVFGACLYAALAIYANLNH
jgi:hypothetical protein